MPHETAICVNAAVELTDQQKAIAEFYFSRIRIFWNLAIEHCDPYFKKYLESPNIASHDHELSESLNTFYNMVRFMNLAKEGVQLERSEIEKISMIRELQTTILRNRLSDIYRIYLRAKTMKLKGYKNIGIPKPKDSKTPQSVRFDPSDYIVSGDTITITGDAPLVFTVPGLSKINFNIPKAVTLNYSPFPRKLGTTLSSPKRVPFYYLTFSDAFR